MNTFVRSTVPAGVHPADYYGRMSAQAAELKTLTALNEHLTALLVEVAHRLVPSGAHAVGATFTLEQVPDMVTRALVPPEPRPTPPVAVLEVRR